MYFIISVEIVYILFYVLNYSANSQEETPLGAQERACCD